ncbi:hypothetical protein AAFC00_006648 [Neodothiora populina]|uniref:Lethal giant larvae (Lgl)-like C-terminal domain-containing protein n=1 Tax=Neodothiora populina TaxID=2781224 RepID=A0ABR3PBE7_9PEZI
MAGLLRGKQVGIQNDLSAGILPEFFAIDDLARFGINSQICALAYDPVQSLLAVGTRDSKFGPGQIYVFGRHRVNVVFSLLQRATASTLQFCAEKLICLDSKHDLSIFSLEAKKLVATYSPPGVATALATDPMLDYAMLGMQTGDIIAYDLDREHVAPFRIPNLWAEYDSRARVSPIVSLAFHPRDIGKILIGYTNGAAVYSFKQNKAQCFFNYEIPPGAPGGDADPASMNTIRRPKLTQAVWHPTGTFILTGHEDSSIVIWDPKDGRIILARTITETNINKPGAAIATSLSGTVTVKEPIFRIAWCAKNDPDDTAILIAGGSATNSPTKGLTLWELGRTPVYATSSWEVLSKHFESPVRQRILPTPPNAEVMGFCLIPRSSPHFAGAQDPIAILGILSSGEIITLSFPSGIPISPTNQLHVSMTFVHPFIRRVNMAVVDRDRWLGMTEARSSGPRMLKGGLEAPLPMRRFESRNIVQTIHADGTVRIWDAGHGDELENPKVLQVDVGRAVGRVEGVDITCTSLAGASGEFVAGTRSGDAAIFRWGHNRNAGHEIPPSGPNKTDALTNIVNRTDPLLSEGLCPFTLLNLDNGPISAVKFSDVGFVAIAAEGGKIAIIDMRGPAIIYTGNTRDLRGGPRIGSIRRRGSSEVRPDWVTCLEFSCMTVEGDNYSSILLHAGTHLGKVGTFKIVPDSSGRYTAQFAGSTSVEGRVIHIAPIDAHTGKHAYASQNVVANLRSGFKVDGAVMAVTPSEVRLFRPATGKGAHKSFDNYFCDAVAVARYQDQGHALVGLFGDGSVRAYSIPALKEIASAKISHILDVRRFPDSVITTNGNILGWTGPSEMALINVWGTGQLLPKSEDKIFNPEAVLPPRPTISNLQWISGSQYITPSDMDVLIGGPDRPPSKRMIAQARSEEQQRLAAERASGSHRNTAHADEGYWAYMQRQIQERTENLNIMGDNMQSLEENSAGWANDVNKFVSQQKKNAVTGIIKAKFGF